MLALSYFLLSLSPFSVVAIKVIDDAKVIKLANKILDFLVAGLLLSKQILLLLLSIKANLVIWSNILKLLFKALVAVVIREVFSAFFDY